MTNDGAKNRLQMTHIILLGAEAQRRIRARADFADTEAKLATIGENIPSDDEVFANLERANVMLLELGEVRLTSEASKVYRSLVKRFRAEMRTRGK